MNRAAVLLLSSAALLISPSLRAEVPLPVFPECGIPDRPDLCPNDLGTSWNFLSYVPVDWQSHVRPEEIAIGAGMAADLTFRDTTGVFDVVIAFTDSGTRWGEENVRRKHWLSRGELPLPQAADGSTSEGEDPWDLNGDGVFNMEDWEEDVRVDAASGSDTDAWQVVDGGDLIATFSDGIDDDGNGFVDDISGWDFMWNDNDPYDETHFNHGYWEEREAAAEGGDGGSLGVCPNCGILPLRVSDSFVGDVNHFASALLYATDQGALVVNCALGGLTHSAYAKEAMDYAFQRGVLVIGSAADETSYHLNFPGGNARALYTNDIRPNDNEPATASSFLQFANGTNFGPRVDVAGPAIGASSRATAVTAGVLGLVQSVSRWGTEDIPPLEPPLTAAEAYQILRMTTDDIDVAESRGEGADPEMYPSQPGFDRYFGYGRVNARRAVDAVLQRRIPPVADLTAPEWYAYLDPSRTGPIDILGTLSASRSSSYSFVAEYAVGEEPLEEEYVQFAAESGLTGAREGVIASFDPASIPSERFDPSAPLPSITKEMDNVTRADRVFQYTLTLRVTVTDAEGNRGEARRAVFFRRDDGVLPGFPLNLGSSAESSPKLADLDGVPGFEIIQATTDGRVHLLNSAGEELPGWPVMVEHIEGADPQDPAHHLDSPAFQSGEMTTDVREAIIATPAVGDITGDGSPEIVVATLGGRLWAWDVTGGAVPGFPVSMSSVGLAETTSPENFFDKGFFASPALGDLDEDGVTDLVAAGLDGKVYAFAGTGQEIAGWPVTLRYDPEGQTGQGNRIVSSPALGDIDGDGHLDVVVGSNQSINISYTPLFAIHHDGNDHQGGPFLSGWPVINGALYTNTLPYVGEGTPSSPALADIDGDGVAEVFASAVSDPGKVYFGDGTLMGPLGYLTDDWGHQSNAREEVAIIFVNSGSFGDMNGDGRPELLDGTVGVGYVAGLAADWKREEFDHMLNAWDMVLPTEGRIVFNTLDAFPQQVEDLQFFMNPAIADLSGDGKPEAISGSGGWVLHAFDGEGKEPEGWPKFTGQWLLGSPAVGDLNGDGYLEVVSGSRGGLLFAWETAGRADQKVEWASFHHDNANTGNYATPLETQEGPPVEGGDDDDSAGDDDDVEGGCQCRNGGQKEPSRTAWILVLAWGISRRRPPVSRR